MEAEIILYSGLKRIRMRKELMNVSGDRAIIVYDNKIIPCRLENYYGVPTWCAYDFDGVTMLFNKEVEDD